MSVKWGLVATIKAPTPDILRFVAFHLQAGAHRLYIYLDDDNPQAQAALKAHPKCRVTACDAAYWAKRNGRPHKHQARQTLNATDAYHRRAEVDWLIHMDVDEFLVSSQPFARYLCALPSGTVTARLRPMEQLAGDATLFKGFIPAGSERAKITRAMYPTFGDHLRAGFLSHLAGKVFVRTGLPDIRFQIHNAFQNGAALEGSEMAQEDAALAHCHARSWEDWIAAYRYRLAKGSYRAELAPNRAEEKGGITLHQLFRTIEQTDGEAGLKAFFQEVCTATPELTERLRAHGLLRKVHLDLDAAVEMHFPYVTP